MAIARARANSVGAAAIALLVEIPEGLRQPQPKVGALQWTTPQRDRWYQRHFISIEIAVSLLEPLDTESYLSKKPSVIQSWQGEVCLGHICLQSWRSNAVHNHPCFARGSKEVIEELIPSKQPC